MKHVMTAKPVIAVDGPAASGKGTLSRRLSEHFAIPHLDTGLTYRAVGYYLLQRDEPLDDEAAAAAAADNLDLGSLDRRLLSQHHIGEAASRVAVMPSVRSALVDAQRRFADASQGAILDGRDIGTVVLPNADVKLYVTASPEMRARRRYEEIRERQADLPDYYEILADITRRDARDMEREDSPLRPAKDATLLDTSEMTIEQAFSAALEAIELARR
ncbi:MAG: (d)CMP kinase [Pseudomonadota bacterium]